MIKAAIVGYGNIGRAVLEAVRAGLVHPSRHASYCVMYEDAKKIKEWELKDHA